MPLARRFFPNIIKISETGEALRLQPVIRKENPIMLMKQQSNPTEKINN